MNVDRILLLAREYASAYSLKDQSEVSRTWMNLKRALQEAAAPQQAEPVGEVRSETCHYSMMPDRICNKCGRVHGYSHPTAAPQRAEPALNERVGLAYKNGYEEALNDCIRNGGEAWARSMFANGGEHIKPQQAEPVEIVPRVWREALRKLTFMARTSGGTPGPDEGLQTACAEAETLLSKPYNYPPAAPQQAEPVAQIGWADEFGNLFPMGAWKPTQRTHHDSHKAAWRPVFLHPPADEVRRLRDALDEIESETQDVSIQQIARKALEGK